MLIPNQFSGGFIQSMKLSREQQIEFAKEMLPLLEDEHDTAKLERLNKLASLLIDWMDKDDNGVAVDLSEYAYELLQIAKGKDDNGWAEQSKKSLLSQIDNQ